MKKLLIATKNPGKVLEYKVLLKNLPLELITLKDLNITADVEEDGRTFEENAVKKAKFYSQLSGLPVIAEDGGLEIDYLGGEPGVKSRRWPGYEASDEELVNLALGKLKGIPFNERGAQLRAVLALDIDPVKSREAGAKQFNGVDPVRNMPRSLLRLGKNIDNSCGWVSCPARVSNGVDGTINTFEGVLRGTITEKPEAPIIPGYPFRCLFYLPEIGKVLGKLSMEEEAEIAHRKQAVKKALPIIKKHLC